MLEGVGKCLEARDGMFGKRLMAGESVAVESRDSKSSDSSE